MICPVGWGRSFLAVLKEDFIADLKALFYVRPESKFYVLSFLIHEPLFIIVLIVTFLEIMLLVYLALR